MKKLRKSLIVPILAIILAILAAIVLFGGSISNVFALADTSNEDNLYSYSNTYDVDYIKTDNIYDREGNAIGTYQLPVYNLKERNKVNVSEDYPQVTFITHGLQGRAAHWSNSIKNATDFAYSENSIIDLLQKRADCNIYLAKMYTPVQEGNITFDLRLYKLKSEDYSYNEDNRIFKITDNLKHSIVIFEADLADQKNDYIYAQFNYMASKILSDLRNLDENKELPRVNLIGHSRGGLTNLQYALDHPEIVDSIFSLGTPYIGSTSASIDKYILDLFGVRFSDTAGEDDIVNPEVYLNYLNRWNTNYNELYSKIKVHALGGYQSMDMLIYEILYYYWGVYLADHTLEDMVLKGLLKDVNIILSLTIGFNDKLPLTIIQETTSQILNCFYHLIPQLQHNNTFANGITALFNIILDELQYNPLTFSYDLLNDGLVDLPSQLGMDGQSFLYYKGFIRHTKRFSIFGNYNLDSASDNNLRVTHNLEARDIEMLSYIVENIDMCYSGNTSDYITSSVTNNSVSILGYVGEGSSEELVIPSTIEIEDGDGNPNNNSKTVVAIGDNAFANNFNGRDYIKNVTIPSTVVSIGHYAFGYNEKLESVTFENGSKLATICEGAFAYTPNLTTFTLPASVNDIGEQAFEGSGITSFTGNSYYVWNSDVLVNKNVADQNNAIAVYVNPQATNIKFPDNVTILAGNLFYGNKNIVSVNFNKVTNIGSHAFSLSTLSDVSNTSNIIDAGIESFAGTKWLDRQSSNYITIGKVLLYYNGDDSQIVVPEGIVRIGENAMSGEQIRSAVLPSTLTSIGQNTFRDCPNLDWVLLKSTNPPVLDGDCFDSDVTIYVKQTSLNYYLNNIYFKNLDNKISSKNVSVTFKDKDGKTLGTKTETYYSTFDKYVSAPVVTGYDFVCWLDPEGKEVYVNNIFTYYNNVILTAYYEPSKYTITLNNGNSNQTVVIEYGETVDLDTPYKQGYNFLGWYDSPTGGNQIIDASGKCVWQRTNEVEALYARFSPITYTISYSTARGTFDGTAPTKFTVESPITTANIPEIKEFGYVFDYWKYGSKSFTTTYGIYSNITLTAKWLGTKTTVTSSTTRTINYEYSIVDMSSASYNGTYSYKIASNVKSVVFIGSTSKTFTDMKISVNSRNTALLIGFNNMKFYPKNGSGSDAIYSPYGCELYVSYKGTNRITGARGADGADGTAVTRAGATGNNGKTGQAGGNGINAWRVNLAQFDDNSFITITGGRGGDGGDGSNGQAGANGTRPPNGSIFAPNKGENGYKGGNGGRGGNGGNGGYAIKVYANTYLKTDKEDTYKLIGGRGGNGGRGGKGGAGGAGADDSSADPFTGVGDPGNGGNGGNGGRGGNGGNGSLATNALYVYGTGGAGGTRGVGGKGGAAGAGGDSGTLGADGNDGLPGVIGKNGAYGVAGATGYNTIGTDESIVTIPYLYDKETIADLFS